jgi:hypothetical protein
VMPPIFFSETTITIVMEFTYIMGTSFTKLRLIFPQSLLHYEHTFFHLCVRHCMLVLFTISAEVSKLFTHTVFQLNVVCKTESLECILQGAKKMEVEGC